jgi:hypothetical protein
MCHSHMCGGDRNPPGVGRSSQAGPVKGKTVAGAVLLLTASTSTSRSAGTIYLASSFFSHGSGCLPRFAPLVSLWKWCC